MSGPKGSGNFFKHVLPFGALVLGAYIGLSEFRKINYGFPKNNDISVFRENLKEVGMSEESYQYKATEGLDEEYKKTIEKINLNDWKNIR